jgi:hypothetical protein
VNSPKCSPLAILGRRRGTRVFTGKSQEVADCFRLARRRPKLTLRRMLPPATRARGARLARTVPIFFSFIALAATTAIGHGTAGCTGNACVELPALSTGDLSCASDEDCQLVSIGTVCACDCNCPDIAANTAAWTRMNSELRPVFSSTRCTNPACECPDAGGPRCFEHQCTRQTGVSESLPDSGNDAQANDVGADTIGDAHGSKPADASSEEP